MVMIRFDRIFFTPPETMRKYRVSVTENRLLRALCPKSIPDTFSRVGMCLGREEGTNGIRSTVIYPGEVNTPILENRPVPVPAERRA